MLSTAQKTFYRDNGFLVLPGVLADAVESIHAAALKIIEDFDPDQHRNVFSAKTGDKMSDDYFYASAENISCFLEEDAFDENDELVQPKSLCINKIGHALELDPAFKAFCTMPLFGEIARDIGYHRPELIQTMYILKPPRIGGEVRWHQDATYLKSEPSTVTGFWISIEAATKENGCLWVQPGGHRSPLREIFQVDHSTGESKLTQLDTTPWPEMEEAVPVEVPPGSVVVFDDHLPHYSSHNASDTSRHAFALHIKEQKAPWDARNWLQRRTLEPLRL